MEIDSLGERTKKLCFQRQAKVRIYKADGRSTSELHRAEAKDDIDLQSNDLNNQNGGGTAIA